MLNFKPSPNKKNSLLNTLLSLVLLLYVVPSFATVYYVSTGGNDNNTGTSPGEAWQTIDKVNSFVPAPGDSILFNRGDEWSGSITLTVSGITENPIVYGAYGIGKRPVIRGGGEVTGWVLHTGNIFKASVDNSINQLFIDDKRAQLSRFPDEGYLSIETLTNTTTFSNQQLAGTNWVGATAILRLVGWSFEAIKIISSEGSTIVIEEVPWYAYAMEVGDLFFVVNSVDAISGPNQWAFDEAENVIYLWSPNGDTPDNYTVTVSEKDYGFTGNDVSHITIQDLDLSGFKKDGISFTGTSHDIRVLNNSLANNYECGVDLGLNETVSAIEITNNTISGSNRDGIRGSGTNITVSSNTIYDIALLENMGMSAFVDAWNTANGIHLYPLNESTVSNNKIQDIGYIGIMFHGLNNTIEKNRIHHTCLTLNDGGGIYCHLDCTGSLISHNIISDCGIQNGFYDHGIYADGTSVGATIANNTCFDNHGDGILIHECEDVTVTENLLYNNNHMQIFVGHNWPNIPMSNNLIAYNIMYTTMTNPIKTLQLGESVGLNISTQINHNTYGSPDEDNIYYIADDQWLYLTIEEFQEISDMGQGAVRPQVEDYSKSILVYNDSENNQTYYLDDGSYSDINGNALTGLSLLPFSSQIVIKNTTISTNRPPEINEQVFYVHNTLSTGELIGQVVASDPDQGQILTYEIVDGNISNMFSISPLGGELFLNYSISTDSVFSVVLEVMVTDNAIEALSSSANITINFSDIYLGAEFPLHTEVAVKLYPNPANSKFTIELNSDADNDFNLVVCNLKGQQIYAAVMKSNTHTVDAGKWQKGVYLIRVLDGAKGLITSRSVVIE
jgi:parallel beta-helix repeat protein